MAAFGEDVVAVVEHLGAGPVVLVGHSMGGDVSAATPEIAVEALRHAVGNEPGVIAGLARLTVPVVAINAERGHTDTAALRRHGVEPVLMPGVGHFLMMEDPEGFNRLLIDTVEGFSA